MWISPLLIRLQERQLRLLRPTTYCREPDNFLNPDIRRCQPEWTCREWPSHFLHKVGNCEKNWKLLQGKPLNWLCPRLVSESAPMSLGAQLRYHQHLHRQQLTYSKLSHSWGDQQSTTRTVECRTTNLGTHWMIQSKPGSTPASNSPSLTADCQFLSSGQNTTNSPHYRF